MSKPVTMDKEEAGTFDWRSDPNFRSEPAKPAPQATVPDPVASGPSTLDTVIATRQMKAGKASSTAPVRRDNLIEKARTFVGDGIGKVVGAIDDDAGNQAQARVAGMRMKNDQAQATAAANAYADAAASAETPELAQQYKDASANIAKGANVAVPQAADGAATLVGSLAEGASRAIPAAGILTGLGAFKDGGEVGRAEFARAWRDAFEKDVLAERLDALPPEKREDADVRKYVEVFNS